MSAQRKRYLQLADAATKPRDRLFYKLMSDLAPAVSDLARKEVNQVGVTVMWDVTMRAIAAIAHEMAFNLTDQEGVEQDRIVASFRVALEQTAESQQILAAVPVTPKLQS